MLEAYSGIELVIVKWSSPIYSGADMFRATYFSDYIENVGLESYFVY